ncbi:MAG: hypothetical protein RIQ53_2620 [Pseudomonadota bacterium]
MSCCCSSLTAVAGAVVAAGSGGGSGGGGGGSGRPVPWIEAMNFDDGTMQGTALQVTGYAAFEFLDRYPPTGTPFVAPTTGGSMLAILGAEISARSGKRVIGVLADIAPYVPAAFSGNAFYQNGSNTISFGFGGDTVWGYDQEIAAAIYPNTLGLFQRIVFSQSGVPILDNVRAIVVAADANLDLIAPFVAAGPRSGNTKLGTAIELSVVAAGAHPVTYQWYLDTGSGPQPISGATNRRYNKSATLADAGTYSVAVTSNGMTVTSAGAVRTVS